MFTENKRISKIENTLVEFTSPSNVFQAIDLETQTFHTLEHRMAHYSVPGVSIAVVKDFEIDWTKAYGVQDVDSNFPVSERTLFEAASSTKLLTATIALNLVQQGHLDLDRDIEEYLKIWKLPNPELADQKKVTLRLLLTHQAGINAPDGGFSWEEGGIPTLAQILNGQAPAQNQAAKLEFVPGSEWQYSNLGFVLIQQLIEDVLDQPFPQIVKEIIFDPLGMESSFLAVIPHEEFSKRIALPHDSEGITHEQQLIPTAVAHGGLITTPDDFSIFLIELMKSFHGESNLILSQEMVKRMLQPELALDPNVLGVPLGQGLGVFLYQEGLNLLLLHPGGNFPGANCWPIAAPKIGGAAVIMTNGAKGDVLGMEILSAILNEYKWLDAF